MHTAEIRSQLRTLLEPTVARLGFDLVAIELIGGDRKPVLRISIDGENGVGADDCARVSLRMSPLLDEADPISGAYRLEVSSPGMERPVQRLDDFRRFVGFRVRIKMEPGLPRRRYTGVIQKVEGDSVVVEVDGEEHELLFESIDSAYLVLELEEYARLAQGAPPVDPEDPSATETSR